MTKYDPDKWDGKGHLPMLYAKTSTGAINIWLTWIAGDSVVVQWGQKDGALQDASFKCEPKNVGRSNETSAHEQARLEAISKWKKQLKKKYFLSEKDAQTKLNLKPMLAKSFKDHSSKIVYPVTVQPKFDGVRCLAYIKDDKPYLQSRGGDPYFMSHILKEYAGCLPQNAHLDGELYVHGMSRQNIVRLVKKERPESIQVKHYLYDTFAPGVDTPWSARSAGLTEFFRGWCSGKATHLVLCPSFTAHNEKEVRAYHDQFVKDGYEGAIIRTNTGIYKIGHRSSDLLKLKAFDDTEFEIVGWKVGKGKAENCPVYSCKMPDGKLFDVMPKGTEAERAQLLKDASMFVGEMLTVRHFGYTDDGLPNFPVGIAQRGPEDMSEED